MRRTPCPDFHADQQRPRPRSSYPPTAPSPIGARRNARASPTQRSQKLVDPSPGEGRGQAVGRYEREKRDQKRCGRNHHTSAQERPAISRARRRSAGRLHFQAALPETKRRIIPERPAFYLTPTKILCRIDLERCHRRTVRRHRQPAPKRLPRPSSAAHRGPLPSPREAMSVKARSSKRPRIDGNRARDSTAVLGEAQTLRCIASRPLVRYRLRLLGRMTWNGRTVHKTIALRLISPPACRGLLARASLQISLALRSFAGASA